MNRKTQRIKRAKSTILGDGTAHQHGRRGGWMMVTVIAIILLIIRIGGFGGWIPLLLSPSTTTTTTTADTHPNQQQQQQQQQPQAPGINNNDNGDSRHSPPLKILYVITTLSEYDGGSRATEKGFDRMQYLLLPVMKDGVDSMLKLGYHVDVVIIAHYEMTRRHILRQALPDSVGLDIWDDAAPKSYPPDKRDRQDIKLISNTLALARQHRFVVKDKLFEYDFFACFEDDMLITGQHVQNHLELTRQLYQLREDAPEEYNPKSTKSFYGENVLTKSQLKRLFPGLIRVETLLDEQIFGTQPTLDPVPLIPHTPPVDVQPCCHVHNATSSTRPAAPTSDKIFLWETGVKALGVRELSGPLGWVVFQRGPRPRDDEKELAIADYWSGRDKYYGKDKRPQPGDFAHVNNQGGWMATRQQIWEWHTEICLGGFLPPYEAPHFNYDGLDMRNVEYWSGGLHLVTARHACNLQRIVSLEPDKFARQLIYHTANNKQRQLHHKKKAFVKIDHFYQQLLTVKKNAQEAKAKEEEGK